MLFSNPKPNYCNALCGSPMATSRRACRLYKLTSWSCWLAVFTNLLRKILYKSNIYSDMKILTAAQTRKKNSIITSHGITGLIFVFKTILSFKIRRVMLIRLSNTNTYFVLIFSLWHHNYLFWVISARARNKICFRYPFSRHRLCCCSFSNIPLCKTIIFIENSCSFIGK